VKLWLDTVGKNLLGIKHHWLRYEFAPSRGQIHAHMLVICDHAEVLKNYLALRDDKEKSAQYISSWLRDTVGMTAEVNPAWRDLDMKQELHPSTMKMSDVPPADLEKDFVRCQYSFQRHKCSMYCMRKRHYVRKDETKEERKRRVCRCGAGVEESFGKCNTPGFPESTTAVINRDIRGFDRVDMPRNNRSITQASKYLCQGWRGNCDIQYLLYKSESDKIDASDVSRVTNYIVSYACKGNETEVEEKMALKDIVLASQTEFGDERDVKKLARRLLNECSKARVISKQEASCQLAGLELYSCSEKVQVESLAGEQRLGTSREAKKSLLVRYANRPLSLRDMNLHDFFDFSNNKATDVAKLNWKVKIPLFTGARCEPVYPATPEYARAILLLYQPWHGQLKISSEREELLREFHKFIHDTNRCPVAVAIGYNRAKLLKNAKEPTTRVSDIDYDTFTVKPDEETRVLVDLVSTIFASEEETSDKSSELDLGKTYPWDKPTIQVR
jgi:hypothetical protein